MSGHRFLISALVLYTQAANASVDAREALCTNDIEGCKSQSPSTDDNNLIQRSVKQLSVAKGLKPYDSSNIRTLLEALQTNLNEKKHAAGPLLKALKTNLNEKKRAAGPFLEALETNLKEKKRAAGVFLKALETNLKEKKHAAGVFLKALKLLTSNLADMQLRKQAPCTDRDADIVAAAAQHGMNISGCADVAAYCSFDEFPTEICPVTCGECPGSTPPPCADKDSIVAEHFAPMTGCADVAAYCSDDGVQQVCPVTCGKCPGSAPPPCADKDADMVEEAAEFGMNISGCADVAEYCSHEGFPTELCPVTCGKCPGSAPPPCADKDSVVAEHAAEQGMTNITGCADVAAYCSDDGAQQVCPVTCGKCPGSGTGPNGEQACENKNFTATQCASVGAGYCCQYDTEENECHSAIGRAVCGSTPPPCADKDAVVAEHAAEQGMTNITGCADIASYCSDDGAQQVCPVTCGNCPNTP